MPPGDREPSEEGPVVRSVIGSESGYQLRTPESEPEDDKVSSVTEQTSLLSPSARLGAGGEEALVETRGDVNSHGSSHQQRYRSAGRDGDSDSYNGGGESDEPAWAGHKGFEHIPKWRRPSVYWLLGPYALFTLAFGGSIVPRLNLIVDLVCQRYMANKSASDPDFVLTPVVPGGENRQCQIPEVQSSVATFNMWLNFIVGVLSAVTVPKIGSLSDRYGRKKLMVVASAGGMLSEAILILAAKYPDTVHYRWLVAGSIFDGLAGSFTAGSVISHSYTSDCTPPSRRGVAIGYLHSCLFLGLGFGPLLAGYLVKWTGELVSVFYATLGCHVFFALFILAILPESVSRKRQLLAREKHAQWREEREVSEGHAALSRLTFDGSRPRGLLSVYRKLQAAVLTSNPLAPLKALLPPGRDNAALRRNLVLFASIDTILLAGAMSAGPVVILYSELEFGWGNFETSTLISFTSLVRVFALLGILPVLNYLFRILPARRRRRRLAQQPLQQRGVATEGGAVVAQAEVAEKNAGADELDIWILRAALLSDVVGLTGYVLVRTPHLFVMSAFATALGGLGAATTQTSLSKHVPPERIGELLGAVGLLHALSRVFAPLAVNGVYAATVKYYRQGAFVLLLAIFAFSFSLSFFVKPHVYLKEEAVSEETPPSPATRGAWDSEDLLSDDEILPVR